MRIPRTTRRASATIAAAVLGVAISAPPAPAWNVLYTPDPNFESQANDAIIAPDGNPIVGGGTGGTFRIVKIDTRLGTEMWRYDIPGSGTPTNYANPASGPGAYDLAFDAAGNVAAAGAVRSPTTRNDIAIVKLDADSGAEIWKRVINGPVDGDDEAYSLAVDAAGNVIAAGKIRGTYDDDLFVVKLAAGDGSELWRSEINGSGPNVDDTASQVAVDAAGDVIVAGSVASTAASTDFFVAKLDGADGSERWRHQVDGTAGGGAAQTVAIAGADVVAGGYLSNTGTGQDFTVMKLTGTNGNEVWRHVYSDTIPSTDVALAVAVVGSGDVLASGDSQIAVRLAGADGAEIWRQLTPSYHNRQMSLDGAGSLFLAGQDSLTKLDVTTGALQWNKPLFPIMLSAAIPDLDGNLIGAASAQAFIFHNACCSGGFDALKLSGAEGGYLATGKKLLVSDQAGDPSRRAIVVQGAGTFEYVGNTSNATLQIVNEGTGERDTYALPAQHWRYGHGSLEGIDIYSDPTLADGPCKKVVIRPPRLFRAVCVGSQIAFSLNEASQGSLSVVFTMNGIQHCMHFGGAVLRDESTANGRGTFLAKDAPSPLSCPPP